MNKAVSFKNHDRFIQLGIAISTLRRMRGLSQEKLAEKAKISRSLLSAIEAPNITKAFSLEVFYDIADALDVDPADLITAIWRGGTVKVPPLFTLRCFFADTLSVRLYAAAPP